MAAVINSRASSSTATGIGDLHPILLDRIEGQVARVNAVRLLSREESGVLTVSDDRSLRLWLRRDNGQFWPSVHHSLPFAITSLFYCEQTRRLILGLTNGAVNEFLVADDLNSVTLKRQWSVHSSSITAVRLSLQAELIFSAARDKLIVWHCSETGMKMGSFLCDSYPTSLQFDADAQFLFAGDSTGSILLLRLVDNVAQLFTKLSAHTGSISDLAWDATRQLLFSSSSDSLVIVWDIGSKRGQAYELTGHSTKLTALAYAAGSSKLFSADENGMLLCWDMKAKRIETPEWKTADTCQLCDAPFFWNFKVMWERKVVGQRQHHCRTCGNAICSACAANTTRFPPMGYEIAVRICRACHQRMTDRPDEFDLTPLASSTDLRIGVSCMHLDETSGRLVTVGFDRVIMIWDIKRFC